MTEIPFKLKAVVLRCDITLYLRNNPKTLLVVPAKFVFYVAQDQVPQEVEGGDTFLENMLPAEYRVTDWNNTVHAVAAWVPKFFLDEALVFSAEAAPIL